MKRENQAREDANKSHLILQNVTRRKKLPQKRFFLHKL
uniref:Uncharacterized protein n=1 Tax=Rhizophora mucronata TaxID=61149 RepID=A0A2P2PG03_RHIMU